MRYRLTIEYDGSEFAGWQIQPQVRTVQGELEAALATLFGTPLRVAAAGRTDAGVHAAGQVAAFSAAAEMPADAVGRALQALTPRDLSVLRAEAVGDDFDPRRDARSRTYRYSIWNRRIASPFENCRAWQVREPLCAEAMAEAARALLGEHDFSSFRAAGCDAAHPVRRVVRSRVWRDGDRVAFEVEANAFLRHMVRNMAGTLREIGAGRVPPSWMDELLRRRNRTQAGATAPACGLCLLAVRYDEGRGGAL